MNSADTPKTKHTPGPWTADTNPRMATVWAKTQKGDMRICDIRGWGHLTGVGALNLPSDKAVEIQDANTNLIAAAPDLLEACKRNRQGLRNLIELRLIPASHFDDVEEMIRQHDELIAKAEGSA